MTTISNVNVFDWNAYEKKLLASKNPTFTQTSTYMRAIGAIMLVGAFALTQYTRRYAFTPSILAYSAVVVICVVAIKILLNKSYKDLIVHDSVQRFKMHVEDMVSKKKGLLHSGNYQNQKDIIWAHIKNYEFTLRYSAIIERNGDIRPLLDEGETKTLGLKYLDGFTAKSLSTKFQEIYDGARAFNLVHEFRAKPIVLEYVTNYVNNFDFENSSREHYLFLCGESFISQSRSVLISDTSNLLVAAEGEMKKKISDRETKLAEDSTERKKQCSNNIDELKKQQIELEEEKNRLQALELQLPQNRLEKAKAELADLEKSLSEYKDHKENPDELKKQLTAKLTAKIQLYFSTNTIDSVFEGIRETGDYVRSLPKLIADTTQSIQEQQTLISSLEAEATAQTNEVQTLKEQQAAAQSQIVDLTKQIDQLKIDLKKELVKLSEESAKEIALIQVDYKKTTGDIIATYKNQVMKVN